MIDDQIRHRQVVDGSTRVGLSSNRDVAFLSNEPAEGLRHPPRCLAGVLREDGDPA